MLNNKSTAKDYFTPLTGVRAIAAYLVYIHHFNPFNAEKVGTSFFSFTQEFHVGVTMFFVLSGFLIAYKYLDMHNFNLRNYLINRAARIYPIYLILTILTFVYYGIIQGLQDFQSIQIFFLNISFLRGFFDSYKFTGIAQGWSLTVEETFYFITPLAFLLINKKRLYLILLPCFFLFFGVLLVLIFSNIHFGGFFYSFKFMFSYTFFGRCFEFFTGITLAILFRKNTSTIGSFKFTLLGVVGIVFSIFFISIVKGKEDLGIRNPAGIFINNIILPIFGITVFYYGLLKEKTVVSKILGSKVFVLLGKSSYIFYLIHMGFILTLLKTFTHNYILIFIVLNVISILLFKLLEEPLNLYLRKVFKKNP